MGFLGGEGLPLPPPPGDGTFGHPLPPHLIPCLCPFFAHELYCICCWPLHGQGYRALPPPQVGDSEVRVEFPLFDDEGHTSMLVKGQNLTLGCGLDS